VHRIRRRRDYLRDPGTPQPGSLLAVLCDLAAAGVPLARVRAALQEVRIEPVLTAHPTEATRRTVLRKEQRLARLLVDRIEQPAMTPPEAATNRARLRQEITLMWQTAERPPVRPTVADEVEHVLFFLTDVVYRVVPALYEGLAAALEDAYGEGAGANLPCPIMRFGSWVGGDMDGNPNVGPDTIRQTLRGQRQLILGLYLRELAVLADHLSQSPSRIPVHSGIEEQCRAYLELLPGPAAAVSDHLRSMPYRLLLRLMSARLEATQRESPGSYAGPYELVEDLQLIAGSLRANRGRHAGLVLIERLQRRVATFGFHLATLDVRQDALVHRRVIGGLLGDSQFESRPPADRARILEENLTTGVEPVRETGDPEVQRTIDVMRAVADALDRYGPEAMGPFVVSMTRGPDDALAVLYLARCAGLTDAAGGVPLDVVPLFETVDDLGAARATMTALLGDPTYRGHVRHRDDAQMVMIGYSDSGKNDGLLASRWALYRAQEELVAAVDAAGVALTVFHGRGGTVSRGGSKPREAILAEPPGAVRGRLRVTEQGEIIHAKYGLRGIAGRTLGLTLGAVLEVHARPGTLPEPQPGWAEAMAAAADAGRGAFRALVYDHPDFIPYFRAATPIDIIERLKIASRPPSRRSGTGLENLRAIPWVFAWTQSRHLLSGWYGVGTGLEHACGRFGIELLAEMAREWPFFRVLLGDVEMVLAKADLAGEAGERVFPLIRAEFERTRSQVLTLTGADELLDREPTLQRAIRLRNPYVDPMSLVQVDLLRRWREGDRTDRELEDALAVTVRGIARGLQNTG
jgi:phosphoenolpyruvate carboxylase